MSTPTANINFERLLELRLLVARHGEMDGARCWNTGDGARRTGVLGGLVLAVTGLSDANWHKAIGALLDRSGVSSTDARHALITRES
ncbi:MAG: hypothetical protein AUK47_06705 [Deltaproteobacteria bacterium CG2_30_63_29]|nr:MAG: hypothetical protein AUK47_06705 [Deltaproteobacteria bacterium CG2_30_63_29]PIV99057.1 MAG: hypothetical protein COW42_12295 [Deltaproteobacteria bacterium CG17_big_fil_post_rev_8_21_14_2_50_63_7]PJB45064.1 MAG: hypothetical protein CO108_07920 [Deltaproteobacteria bacterium CG_4_9_14_3_um_filter_63_12]